MEGKGTHDQRLSFGSNEAWTDEIADEIVKYFSPSEGHKGYFHQQESRMLSLRRECDADNSN